MATLKSYLPLHTWQDMGMIAKIWFAVFSG
jgi:hypothetical protein